MVVLQQRGRLLGVDGLGAEPEELLGVDEVPGAWLATCLTSCLPRPWRMCDILGEVAALVLELAILDGLGLLLRLLGCWCGSIRLSSRSLGGRLLGSLCGCKRMVSKSCRCSDDCLGQLAVSHTSRGSLLLSSLDGCGVGSNGSSGGLGGGRRSLLGGDRDGLLFLGHCDL